MASNDSQSGLVTSPNDLNEEDDDDGAYAREVLEERNRKGSGNQAAETHEDLSQVEKVFRRPQVKHFRRSKRIDRPVQEGERRPVTRSQGSMPSSKSQNATLSQLRQLSRPRSNSVNRSYSPQTASPRIKASRRTNASRPSANLAYQIINFTHYHVPEGSSILTVILRSESNLPLNPKVLDREILDGKSGVVRITQLSLDLWMLLGYRYDDSGLNISTRESRTLDTMDWVSSPCSNAASHETDYSNDEDEDYKEDLGKPKVYATKSNIHRR